MIVASSSRRAASLDQRLGLIEPHLVEMARQARELELPGDVILRRLAALLESARAQSRTSGVAVRWHPTDNGFRFDGLPPNALPGAWLHPATSVAQPTVLLLGPEPVIGPQAVVLVSSDLPDRSVRVATDGLRPFAPAAP